MKHFNTYIILATIIVIFNACSDFLERNPLSQASESTFWKSEGDAEMGINALYPLLPGDRDFWRDCQSDNSLMTNAWGEGGLGYISQGIHNSATNYLREEWTYNNIFRILYYLDKLDNMTIDQQKKERLDGEARFILALTYYRMTRHFGDIPLIKEKPIELENAALPRSSKQEVLDYVLENINKAIEYLPISYSDSDIGRINKAAALTLKADIYLDMASYKQFHHNQDASSFWKEAADAALEVVEMNMFDLEEDYSFIFTSQANNNNKEVILAKQYLENEISHMLPVLASPSGVGVSGEGWASFCPTRQLIDSYEMLDGKTIYESELYDMNNPWENRDLRLKKTYFLPGVEYLRPNGKFEPYMPHPAFNKMEKINAEGGGITGFMYLKYNDLSLQKPYSSWINFSLYRYAEVLLVLAEALNEYDSNNSQIAISVNKVRARAGLPDISEYLGDKEKMREIIRSERRHEFPAEHKRYFDILRWKIAEDVLNEPGYGINKDEKSAIGDYTQEKFLGQNRAFDPSKHYLWPIPQRAIDNNPNLTQNSNW